MATNYFAIILVCSVGDMPKIEEQIYKEAFFSRFRDDIFKEKFEKLCADYPQYSFILGIYSVEQRKSVVQKVLHKERFYSVFIYENVDGKDVVSLIKGDESFLKYFQ